MLDVSDLTVPVVAAPMAGGPSTPALVTAVARAGGLGFLAAGYLSADAFAAQLQAAADARLPYGVNVFVPENAPLPPELAPFRERVAVLARRYGIDAVPEPRPDDDGYAAKLDLIADARPDVVSFAFGCPEPEVVRRMRATGAACWVTVTCPADARRAEAAGADALVVQGPEAGGHRSTFRVADEPDARPLTELLAAVRAVTTLPLVAAGGIAAGSGTAAARDAGATAVQCGTAFLLADEAGTNPTHRAALADPGFHETRVTRAYSGRLARGLANAWVDEFADAPAAYPAVNQVTAPVRRAAAAAGDAQHTHLWAGTGWREARTGPAADVVAALAPTR